MIKDFNDCNNVLCNKPFVFRNAKKNWLKKQYSQMSLEEQNEKFSLDKDLFICGNSLKPIKWDVNDKVNEGILFIKGRVITNSIKSSGISATGTGFNGKNGPGYGKEKHPGSYASKGIDENVEEGVVYGDKLVNEYRIESNGDDYSSGGSVLIVCKTFVNTQNGSIWGKSGFGRIAIYTDNILVNQGDITPEPYYGTYEEGLKILKDNEYI